MDLYLGCEDTNAQLLDEKTLKYCNCGKYNVSLKKFEKEMQIFPKQLKILLY